MKTEPKTIARNPKGTPNARCAEYRRQIRARLRELEASMRACKCPSTLYDLRDRLYELGPDDAPAFDEAPGGL